MEIVSDHASSVIPSTNKAASLKEKDDEPSALLTVQRVAEIAAAAHRPSEIVADEDDDDAHTDLLAFPPRHSLKRHGSLGIPPRRSQSLRVADHRGGVLRTSSMHRGEMLRGGAPPQSSSSRNATLSNSLHRSRGNFQRAPPGRSVSTDGSLRGMRRDQLANTSIASSFDHANKERGVLRTRSGDSMGSDMDASCFTTDSINLRKTQLIADPVLEGGYNDFDSCADHESIMDAMSYYEEDWDGYSEYLPVGRSDAASVGDVSFCTLDSIRIRQLQIHNDVSFLTRTNSCSSLASADAREIQADLADDKDFYEVADDEDITEVE